jgi:hypothetical protein
MGLQCKARSAATFPVQYADTFICLFPDSSSKDSTCFFFLEMLSCCLYTRHYRGTIDVCNHCEWTGKSQNKTSNLKLVIDIALFA